MIINTIKGKPEESKTVALDMASGNQVVTPSTGKVLNSVTVTKPETLVAGNVRSGVTIGGVVGTMTGLPTYSTSVSFAEVPTTTITMAVPTPSGVSITTGVTVE